MPRKFQFATAAFLLTATFGVRAQITNPDALVAPKPQNPARSHRPLRMQDDLQWLWQYAKPLPNGRAYDLRVDARFQAMLAREFRQPQAMWGPESAHEPLASVIPVFLTKYGTVTGENNRYFMVDGCVPRFCPAHGLLWIDLGRPQPLIVFAAVNWNPDGHSTDELLADYNLWLFSNRDLDADALPLALTEDIAHWDARLAAAHRLVPHVQHAILVEPNGQPFPVDPAMAGANTLKPQPDTLTPTEADDE